jgi:hypothetical protein
MLVGLRRSLARLRSIHSNAVLFGVVAALAIGVAACSDEADVPTGPSDASGAGSNRIKLRATVSNRSGLCPSIRFRLGGISVETNATTDFEFLCDRVTDGTPVEVDGATMTNGVLVARTLEANSDGLGQPRFEAEGAILSVSSMADCEREPGRRVNVRGLNFFVGIYSQVKDVTNGCEGLAVGGQVKARGPLVNPPSAPLVPPRAAEIEGED